MPKALESAQRLRFWPPADERDRELRHVARRLDVHLDQMRSGHVAPTASPHALRKRLREFDFARPMPLEAAVERTLGLLGAANTNMMHAGYLGLFNPSVTFAGVVADLMTATINPQLAVWAHAPAAVEMEAHTIAFVAKLVGWDNTEACGHFTSGGAEANYTKPSYAEQGARAFSGQPRLYVSQESHLAWFKIAHQAGIGRDAVCLVPTDGAGRMDTGALDAAIRRDINSGLVPVLVGATAGTTNAGMIDPLAACRRIAIDHRLWFHVDAAWGGAALVCEHMRSLFNGIRESDSITVDAHKWFAVPMGAGMFLCRDRELLGTVFGVQASYMPSATGEAVDPYTHSAQWSRRFIGLKLFLSLATLGIGGYRQHVERSVELAAYLKRALIDAEWKVVNDSPLAVVCFVNPIPGFDAASIAEEVVRGGSYWISAAKFEGQSVLRACITGHFTTEARLHNLVADLSALSP
jgi:glutamate/tyrosine decarboxylase-like PLP-dependent enzyme